MMPGGLDSSLKTEIAAWRLSLMPGGSDRCLEVQTEAWRVRLMPGGPDAGRLTGATFKCSPGASKPWSLKSSPGAQNPDLGRLPEAWAKVAPESYLRLVLSSPWGGVLQPLGLFMYADMLQLQRLAPSGLGYYLFFKYISCR